MNKLELTTEQIGKLFEMLKFFFKNELEEVFTEGNVLFKTFHEDDKIPYIKIHWLEVCMTHLSSKVIFVSGKPLYYCKDTYMRLSNNLIATFFDEDKKVHPVDFLHTEFVKNFVNKSVESAFVS